MLVTGEMGETADGYLFVELVDVVGGLVLGIDDDRVLLHFLRCGHLRQHTVRQRATPPLKNAIPISTEARPNSHSQQRKQQGDNEESGTIKRRLTVIFYLFVGGSFVVRMWLRKGACRARHP